MARGAIEALRADREALLAIGARLSGDDWRAGSGCPGWSVQDVVAHMGTLFWAGVDPAALPDTTGLAPEPAQAGCRRAGRLRIGEHRSPGAPGRPGAPGFRAGSRGSRDLPGVRPAERVLLRPLHPHPRGSVRPARAPHRPATPLR